jgi:REP element-mobilizing transposase RayT
MPKHYWMNWNDHYSLFPTGRNTLADTVIIPNLCQACHKYHRSTCVKECRMCSDLPFPEQMLCTLVRDAMRDEDSFECHAFRPKLSVVNDDNTEQSQTEEASEDIGSTSQKEKWFKAYAVQQLEMNPDLIYAKLRFHVVVSTTQRRKLFSHQHADQISEILHHAEFPFENTTIHLLCLASDHIHLYIDSSPDYSLDEIVNAVMTYSEQAIPVHLPELQQSSELLWERTYFSEGIG